MVKIKLKTTFINLGNTIKKSIKRNHTSIEIPFNSKTEKLVIVVKKGVSTEYVDNLVKLISKSININSSVLILPGEFIKKIKIIKR
jgi:hypothetical protein